MPTNRFSSPQSSAPTLTEVTAVGRKVLKYALIALISYMVLKLLISSFISWWKAIHPEPPPPPSVGFGKLPHIQFPEQERKENITYNLETARGRFPSFPDRAKVYAMQPFNPSLLADDQVRAIAQSFGFENQPEVLDANTYRWSRNQPIEMVFEIKLDSFNFSLSSDYLTRSELIAASHPPDNQTAIRAVKNELNRAKLLPADVATAAARVSYWKGLGGELIEAVSLSDADFVQVDIDRVPIDGQYDMYTPRGHEGIISGVVAGGLGSSRNSLVSLDYRYQPVNYTLVETYPLRSINEAWKEFNKGEGYVASGQDLQEVAIRNVFLGYYDDFAEQEYLQPIYVFVGDDNFLGYVSAIESSYYLDDSARSRE
jgi:hypothetical protein